MDKGDMYMGLSSPALARIYRAVLCNDDHHNTNRAANSRSRSASQKGISILTPTPPSCLSASIFAAESAVGEGGPDADASVMPGSDVEGARSYPNVMDVIEFSEVPREGEAGRARVALSVVVVLSDVSDSGASGVSAVVEVEVVVDGSETALAFPATRFFAKPWAS